MLIDYNEIILQCCWYFSSRNRVTSNVATEKNLADKWCSVSYCTDPHMIRMTDRCCSCFLDKRVGIINITLQTLCYGYNFKLKKNVNISITYINIPQHDQSIYYIRAQKPSL
jgi:hypothetical protein